MPTLNLDSTTLFYRERGSGEMPVVFSHGLLMDHRQFAAQVEYFSDAYRCVAYDLRGQGQSEVPETPVISMETHYFDAVALIEELDLAPCHFVGTSMGGMAGLRLASRRPDLVESVVLINTRSGREPPENLPKYKLLNFVARWFGLQFVVDRIMPIMFCEEFLEDPSRADLREEYRERFKAIPRSIYRTVNGVLYRPSFDSELPEIDVPVLVVHGTENEAVDHAEARQMAQTFSEGDFVSIPDAGHAAVVERPEAVNRAMTEFFDSLESA